MPFIKIKPRLIAATSLLLVGSFATAAPSVSDNTISWPDDGWYQVQDQTTHAEVCGGGRSCEVETGIYVVINHSTGERFNNITVVGDDGPTNGVTVTDNTISWPDDGWYQVQDQTTHAEVCGGGRSCEVETGIYVVINHSSGERFNNITVVGDDGPTNGVTVTDNTISWPDDGWYQVQDQTTHAEVCGGGRSCEVETGTYVVINHSTGERFNDITVVGDGGPVTTLEPVQASLELVADKTFRLSWLASEGAEYYRILENPDGVSGFNPISEDLESSTISFDHRVALYHRINARYIVQACNSTGCTDSDEHVVTGNLESAVGILRPSNLEDIGGSGFRISIDGDGNTLAVGTRTRVVVFVRDEGLWTEQAILSGGSNNFSSGGALSLSADGHTLAVGSNSDSSAAIGVNGDQQDPSISQAGAVFVYVRNDNEWQQHAFIKASNPQAADNFGSAIGLSADGNTLVVGAPNRGSRDVGAAYVFSRSDGNWQEQAILLASNAQQLDHFGGAVAVSGDGNTLAVGATGEDSMATGVDGNQSVSEGNSAGNSGAVYVFSRSGVNWQQEAYVKASTVRPTGFFGLAISLSGSGDVLVAKGGGAIGDAVEAYSRSDGGWQHQTTLPGGDSLSLSENGRFIAIGIEDDESAATGINGDQSDTSIPFAGAVFLFTRSDEGWNQHAYVKTSTAGRNFFGQAVSLSADGLTMAVGGLGRTGIHLY